MDEYWAYGWSPKSPRWTNEPDKPDIIVNDQAGIYVLQNTNRQIVYVGQSGRGKSKLGDRLWSHTRNHNRERWTHFSWFGLNEPTQYEEAPPADAFDKNAKDENSVPMQDARDVSFALNELEAMLIAVLEPPLNKRGGDWGNAKSYLQWSHFSHPTNHDLWDMLSKKRLKKIVKHAVKRG